MMKQMMNKSCRALLACLMLMIGVWSLPAQAQTFSATGSLTTARNGHTATLLGNGKVLVTGGDNSGALASSELYDPATGTFSATGSLSTARSYHTATLLGNGKVLITGGYNSGSPLASTELYDSATGTFSATGSMATARGFHTATLLGNGKVLVTGGLSPVTLASSELYDPATGTFSATGSLTTARYAHTATLLSNGKVLITGGDNGRLSSSELYDPATGTFSATGSLVTGRAYHMAALLGNGKVLITGGYGSSGGLASSELYDPVTSTFSATGSMATARSIHTATLLGNVKVLVTGGDNSGRLASSELYDPATGTFSATGSLTNARYYHTATLLGNGKVLVTGGDNSGALASSELYTTPASFSINDVTANEGNSGTTNFTLTVTRSGDTSGTSTVHYVTSNGTATAGSDFTAIADTTLTFAPGDTTKTITVAVTGDQGLEPNETFNVTLSNPTNASITTATGLGTITNDDTGLIVTTTADTTNGSDNDNSLREAINAANANADASTITFNISGAGVQTLAPATALPTITEQATIDGYTQPGASANTLSVGTNAVLRIELTGAGTVGFDGLIITAATCTVRGLAIGNCRYGIQLTGAGATGNVISGNYLGTRADGATALANSVGIQIFSAVGNTIGGTAAGARNVISGNSDYGIWIFAATATGNTVKGNYIGTAADGATACANLYGVQIADGVGNTIGGTSAAERNIISGNVNTGIRIEGSTTGVMGNVISGNYIGTQANGTTACANITGVEIIAAAVGNTIGGTTAGARNVISGNSGSGIEIHGGGTRGTVIRGNYIGTQANGATPLSNSIGIYLQGGLGSNTIGGTAAGEGNVISGNIAEGVRIFAGTGNSLRGNSIYNNGFLGFDLNSDSVTANDTGDGDTGANNLQNYPVVTSAISNGVDSTVAGTLNSTSNTTFTLDFYDNAAADPSGFGEGQTYLGSGTVTTDGSGNGSFSTTLTGVIVTSGHAITATATDPGGNTSEFSQTIAPTVPTLTINDVSATEGSPAAFTVTATLPATRTSATTVTVKFATANGTTNPATAGSDYTAISPAQTLTITISANTLSATGTVSVTTTNDTIDEVNETFFVNLSNPTNAIVSDAQGVGTITDNDTSLITINDVTVPENGGPAVFTVSLSTANSQQVTVNYATANGTTNPATAGSDYTTTNGTLTWTAGTTTAKTISVPLLNDTTVEANKTFFVNLSGATNATISDAQGLGTISDDDAVFSINDATTGEGGTATFTVTATRSIAVAQAITVSSNYATANGMATTPADYTSKTGAVSVTIAASGTSGTNSTTIAVPALNDALTEGNETFFVNLSGATNGTYSDSQGQGTITDPAPPSLTINDMSVSEGGTATFTVAATLTGTSTSATTVTVNYASADGTTNPATAGTDYTAISPAQTLTITIPANTLSATGTVSVATTNDTIDEVDETFFVNLSSPTNATIGDAQGVGTITDNDTSLITINDVSVPENGGPAVFTVSLSTANSQQVTVNYATANGTTNPASAGSDYTTTNGTLTWAAGTTTAKTISVPILDNAVIESTETFFVNLSGATNATISDAQGIGTITNDDLPKVFVSDVQMFEGDSGNRALYLTFALNASPAADVTVTYATQGITATSGSDYGTVTGSYTFPANTTTLSRAVGVIIVGNTVAEADETFILKLTSVTGATILKANGTATIVNDDGTYTGPVNVGVTPNNGGGAAGTPVTFTTVQSDANGAADISQSQFIVNTTIGSPYLARCYYNGTNLYLMSDAGTFVGGFTPGSANVISNSQVSLNCAGTTVVRSGNTLTIQWNLTFNASYTGTKNLFLYAKDNTNQIAGWDNLGTWTITGAGILSPVSSAEDEPSS